MHNGVQAYDEIRYTYEAIENIAVTTRTGNVQRPRLQYLAGSSLEISNWLDTQVAASQQWVSDEGEIADLVTEGANSAEALANQRINREHAWKAHKKYSMPSMKQPCSSKRKQKSRNPLKTLKK
jgi:hypothetical protein